MSDKYSHFDETTAFGFLVNALGGGGDRGQSFPQSDAEDLSRGLRFIPGEVTLARREGKRVPFVQDCHHPCCWFWQFPNGAKTYYWERGDFEHIARLNGRKFEGDFRGEAGACPRCGNPHTGGGHIEAP